MKALAKRIPALLKRAVRSWTRSDKCQAQAWVTGSRRLDICAAQFAHVLSLAGRPSLEAKRCLELGAGWVLSAALVCHLLGARKVVATDIAPHAHPEALPYALKMAVPSIVRDLLSLFADNARVRQRYERLLPIQKFSFETLQELGIEYVSPFDFARQKMAAAFDFIYSFSALEHVPREEVQPLLANLADALAPGGGMIHYIHLEDHAAFARRPVDFLRIPPEQYARALQTERGNRIRMREWLARFGEIPGTSCELLFSHRRTDCPLPADVDRSIAFADERDLRTSHLGICLRKPVSGQAPECSCAGGE